jgi:hypothetical protein
MSTRHWNITVSEETDKRLRLFLAQIGGRKGDRSRFVEEAVKTQFNTLNREQPIEITPLAVVPGEANRSAQ